MAGTWTLRIRLLALAGLAALFVALMAGLGLTWLNGGANRTVSALESTQRQVIMLHAIESAHAHFKAQVQEWKNILLRSTEPSAFDKHRKRFDLEAESVTRLLRQAAQQAQVLGIDTTEVAQLSNAHGELTRIYLSALQRLEPQNERGALAVDRLVRSLDRGPSERFEAAAAALEARTRRHINELLDGTRADASTGSFVLVAAGSLGIVLALLVLVWTSHEMLLQIRQSRSDGGAMA